MNLLEIGIEKGIEQSRTEIIQNMLKNGLSSEEVSEVTQIPLDDVKDVERKANVSKQSALRLVRYQLPENARWNVRAGGVPSGKRRHQSV